jgi:hypothetical protein
MSPSRNSDPGRVKLASRRVVMVGRWVVRVVDR